MEEGLEPAVLQLSEGRLSKATADFVAGGAAGACGVVAGQPLDTVRIRQQAQRPGGCGVGGGGGGVGGAVGVVRSMLRGEGPRALLRGMSYPLATAALQNAVVFQAYGIAARFLSSGAPAGSHPHAAEDRQQPPQPPPPPPQSDPQQQLQSQPDLGTAPRTPPPEALSLSQVFMAGCFAGAVQTSVVVPVDVLKIRLQLQTAVRGSPAYVGPLSLLAKVVRSEGLKGLYRGTPITFIRDFPSHGVYFGVYEASRQLLEGRGGAAGGGHSALALWAAGGLAGAVSWLSVYPFDVIKTKMQATPAAQSQYAGWLDCARQMYAAEGLPPFFRGLSTTLTRAFLVNGAIFTAYELTSSLLSQ